MLGFTSERILAGHSLASHFMCSFEHLTDFFSNDFTLLKGSSNVCTNVLSIEADTITYAECFIS